MILVSLVQDMSGAFVARKNDLCGKGTGAQELEDQVTSPGTEESVRGGAANPASSSAFILALTRWCVLLPESLDHRPNKVQHVVFLYLLCAVFHLSVLACGGQACRRFIERYKKM